MRVIALSLSMPSRVSAARNDAFNQFTFAGLMLPASARRGDLLAPKNVMRGVGVTRMCRDPRLRVLDVNQRKSLSLVLPRSVTS